MRSKPPLSPRHHSDKEPVEPVVANQSDDDTTQRADSTWRPKQNVENTLPPRRQGSIPLARALAEAGLGTRRKIALWLESGRLLVNNQPALPGAHIDIDEITRLTLDGVDIPPPSLKHKPSLRIIAYHKAVGELCSLHDPRGRPLAHLGLPLTKGRPWISVGRLDYMTEGLLLFTNNGELAYRLMHPSYGLERVYVARVYGRLVDDAMIQEMLNGVLLDDGPVCFTSVQRMRKQSGMNTWLRVALKEGRNREVRRLFHTLGLKTNHLIRIQYGSYRLSLKSRPGNWRDLSWTEKRRLIDLTGLDIPDLPADKPLDVPGEKPLDLPGEKPLDVPGDKH